MLFILCLPRSGLPTERLPWCCKRSLTVPTKEGGGPRVPALVIIPGNLKI